MLASSLTAPRKDYQYNGRTILSARFLSTIINAVVLVKHRKKVKTLFIKNWLIWRYRSTFELLISGSVNCNTLIKMAMEKLANACALII